MISIYPTGRVVYNIKSTNIISTIYAKQIFTYINVYSNKPLVLIVSERSFDSKHSKNGFSVFIQKLNNVLIKNGRSFMK